MADDFNTSWSTNVMGPILTTNAFLPLLKKGNVKKVLTLSSGLGDANLNRQSEFPAHTSYCVSKAALEMVIVKYASKCYPSVCPILALITIPRSRSQR